MWAVVTLWVAGSFCGVKSWKSRNYLRYFVNLTCLPLIKTFCILLSKLCGRLFTIFTEYIVSVFLACFYNGRACSRFPAWPCPLKRAVYSTPDSQCLECYIYRLSTIHNAKDRSLGVGRDIHCNLNRSTVRPFYTERWCSKSDFCSSRSSSAVTLPRPPVSASLQATFRSFRSPYLWNELPSSFRQPHSVHSPPD